jgi:membrane fusion protein (multidrug efflux system)
VLDSENKVSVRNVKVSDRVGNMWIIADGLKPGERVIAEGVQKAAPGVQVNPKTFVGESTAEKGR